MFADKPSELMVGDAFIRLRGIVPKGTVHLKIEGFTSGGSIKTKTARHMLDQHEARGHAHRDQRFIESSSGNLGLALSMIAAERGYRFTCVSDPNLSPQTHKLMLAFGAEVVIVEKHDANGGYLGTRIAYIRQRLEEDAGLVWLNQYANADNAGAHLRFTGPEIFSAFPRIDFLFVGAGTTGTLGGISHYARQYSPATKLIAVDSVGSVTFGLPSGRRYIAGLGTSCRPPIADDCTMDALEMIEEADTIVMCRRLAAQGLLVGGSTGTVLTAVARYAECIPPDAVVVAVSPDLGDRYVDTIYDNTWVESRFAGLLERCGRTISAAPLLWERHHG
ncbi:2,3-diaminopropionate biosynthesis protein SbnA [Burkholderia sp. FERM BP-3421]|jgi:cysteine synthase A|uniref:2,3-diaminopropionate biosynthesis protein SbnA n=1 Tax=Burkholderia sp. FERM BP-3421 TaxID=1494466 RepID=UPI002361971D|nr:2,3-diaminopropionate biosynthesis protein SbnA [Burkholderia sp. FERM BP-3421]WDD93594.1 2,3-diaminopropionate biosynthesis protein SbnA [Burkholderia sp. FERM BP-3421]